jgi:hypothetical protein
VRVPEPVMRPPDNDNVFTVFVKFELLRVPPATLSTEEEERLWDAPMERLPELRFTLPAAREPFNCRTPAVMERDPENVLEPESVSWAVPALVSALVPLRMPLIETALSMERMESAERTPGPVNVRVPEVEGLPSAKVPARANALDKVRAVEESLETRPPDRLRVPEPKALLFPARRVPLLREIPPENPLALERVSAEEPLLTIWPLPETRPLKLVPSEPLSVSTLLELPKLTVPAPAIEAISWELLRKSTPPEDTVTALEVARALPPWRTSEPPLTVVVPRKLLAPESVKTPSPDLLSEPGPTRLPEKVPLAAPPIVSNTLDPTFTVPAVPVIKPTVSLDKIWRVAAEPPNVIEPASAIAFPPLRTSVPPLMVVSPV